jgi:hypothetical protein
VKLESALAHLSDMSSSSSSTGHQMYDASMVDNQILQQQILQVHSMRMSDGESSFYVSSLQQPSVARADRLGDKSDKIRVGDRVRFNKKDWDPEYEEGYFTGTVKCRQTKGRKGFWNILFDDEVGIDSEGRIIEPKPWPVHEDMIELIPPLPALPSAISPLPPLPLDSEVETPVLNKRASSNIVDVASSPEERKESEKEKMIKLNYIQIYQDTEAEIGDASIPNGSDDKEEENKHTSNKEMVVDETWQHASIMHALEQLPNIEEESVHQLQQKIMQLQKKTLSSAPVLRAENDFKETYVPSINHPAHSQVEKLSSDPDISLPAKKRRRSSDLPMNNAEAVEQLKTLLYYREDESKQTIVKIFADAKTIIKILKNATGFYAQVTTR